MLLLPTLGLVTGFILLLYAADRFVDGASALASNFGVAPLIVGLVVVGFGTSAPEILVSAMSAWDGRPELALGNAVGSNIVNIALILGLASLIQPLEVHSRILRREMPIPLAAMLFALILLLDGVLGRGDGMLLLLGFFLLMYWTVSLALNDRKSTQVDPMVAEYAAEMPDRMSTQKAVGLLVVGLLLMLVSSRLLIWAAVEIAQSWGLSDLIIGLTIVSIGTGLPELATTISAARKGEHDIAIGNIVGSNTFNVLAVIGIAGTIHPGAFAPEVLTRDFPVMIGLSLALFAMAYGFKGDGRINRVEGGLLLACFVGYMVVLVRSNGG